MKKRDEQIQLSKEQKESAVIKIKEYIEDNFEIEVGNLQSSLFLNYITEHIGVYYYNQAISDSMSYMNEKVEEFYLLMKDEE